MFYYRVFIVAMTTMNLRSHISMSGWGDSPELWEKAGGL